MRSEEWHTFEKSRDPHLAGGGKPTDFLRRAFPIGKIKIMFSKSR
jgi:hypothetical protein